METFGAGLAAIELTVTLMMLGLHGVLRRGQLRTALSGCDPQVAKEFRWKVWRYCLFIYSTTAVFAVLCLVAALLALQLYRAEQLSVHPFWAAVVLLGGIAVSTMVNAIFVAVRGITPVLERMGFRARRTSAQTGPLRRAAPLDTLSTD